MWVLTLAFLTCLCVDFTNPLLPGAVRFGDDASVDGLHAGGPRTDGRAPQAQPRPSATLRSVGPSAVAVRPTALAADGLRARDETARPRGLIDTARAAPPSAEDH